MTQLANSLSEDQAWTHLQNRDRGTGFLYAVTTTGVFCRPGCSSRLPLRANTRFFTTPAEARAAGFRPCLRCKPEEAPQPSVIARICAYLEQKIDRPVRLAELGRLVKMSPFTVQRLFKKEMGVSPAAYQRAIRAHSLRGHLRNPSLNGETNVTSAIYEAGYGSSSRAYEKLPLGMTPGRFLAGGRGETIGFAIAEVNSMQAAGPSWLILGSTERGICWLALGDSPEAAEATLRAEFPAAAVAADPALASLAAKVIRLAQGEKPAESLPLDLRGTAFQLRVWNALQQIPAGETRTYSQLAAEMGIPRSTRAVARACATNRVSVLVPCHRVVGASGSLTGYRWGVERKRALLNNENARLA